MASMAGLWSVSNVLLELLLLFFSVLAPIVTSASATCYRPDGSAIDSAYQPCNGSAPVSMCCHLGVANNNGDVCGSGSSYGLCGVTGTQLWRESCTDPMWESPLCLKLCINGADDQMITSCPDGSYCCGSNNATCCDAGQGQFIVNNAVSNTSAPLSSASPSSTSSTTSPATSPATSQDRPSLTSIPSFSNTPLLPASPSTAAPSASTGLSASAVVGIAIVVTLALVASVFFWKRKQMFKHSQMMARAGHPNEKNLGMVSEVEMSNRSELGVENMPPEAGGSLIAEMDDRGATIGYGFPWRAAELPTNDS